MTTKSTPNKEDIDEILFDLASAEYHNGRKSARGKEVPTAFEAIETAKSKLQELYIKKSDVEEAIGEATKIHININSATDGEWLSAKEIRTKLKLNLTKD